MKFLHLLLVFMTLIPGRIFKPNQAVPFKVLMISCYPDGTPDPCNHSTINGIDLLSTQDGWAVGDNGLILHWNGSTWFPVTNPFESIMLAVDMDSETSGLAVG